MSSGPKGSLKVAEIPLSLWKNRVSIIVSFEMWLAYLVYSHLSFLQNRKLFREELEVLSVYKPSVSISNTLEKCVGRRTL